MLFLFIVGKDPLPDKVDGKDINSVAGVLKLYFRELKEPLFPSHIFDDLIECSRQHNFNSQYTTVAVWLFDVMLIFLTRVSLAKPSVTTDQQCALPLHRDIL